MSNYLNFLAVILLSITLLSCSEDSLETPSPTIVAEESAANGFVGDDRTDGYNSGYFWTMYKEGGWAKMNFPYAGQYGGNFEVEYKSNQDVVGGKGWRTGSGRTINYNIGTLQGSYAFVGVYGWSKTPLIEYYISEKGYGISGQNQNKNVTINGKNYKFKKNTRYNKPSILGTKTFDQYINEHGSAPTGSNQQINMQAHFNHWDNNGGHKNQWGIMRNFDYQVFGIENFNGQWGKINATIW
ncbi:MAG: glycoside hydrolase family 11 protein [Reichenbachiella sp.]